MILLCFSRYNSVQRDAIISLTKKRYLCRKHICSKNERTQDDQKIKETAYNRWKYQRQLADKS